MIFLLAGKTLLYSQEVSKDPVVTRQKPDSSAKKLCEIRFGALQQLGVNFVSTGMNYSFKIVNGIRFGKFFTGIGAAYDGAGGGYGYSYGAFQTYAIFADGRWYMNKNKNFFVVGDAGMVFMMDQPSSYNRNMYYAAKPGFYSVLGLGFKAKLGKEVFYTFDIGYSYKMARYGYNYTDFRGIWTPEGHQLIQNRIVVNMGIEIF